MQLTVNQLFRARMNYWYMQECVRLGYKNLYYYTLTHFLDD